MIPAAVPPDPQLPVSPIGPDFLGFLWELTSLDTTVMSLVTSIAICLGVALGAVFIGAVLARFVPYIGRPLQVLMTASAVSSIVASSFLIGSWISDKAVSPQVMNTHAAQVLSWLRSSGNAHATMEQSLALVCEYHHDKSEICGKSVGGVAVSGYNEAKVVLRLDDAGNYRVWDAASAGEIDL